MLCYKVYNNAERENNRRNPWDYSLHAIIPPTLENIMEYGEMNHLQTVLRLLGRSNGYFTHLLSRRRGIILDGNPASHQDSITAEWLSKLEQTPFDDVISGGAVCTHGFGAHPVHTGGIHAWSFVIAEMSCSPPIIQNCPQVYKIKQLNRREKLAINMLTGANIFIKLKS